MVVKSTKLRRLTIGMQLLAGVSLLTASYLTTDLTTGTDWASQLIEAAIHTEQVSNQNALQNMKAGIGC
ncbi:MAG: hypothetical protein DRQ47_08685 [Gammaproteobacteria bacterium]|nr:MAG: hypothetical protein DRQ47_08685 [Gammaproteobacteria bacterium]